MTEYNRAAVHVADRLIDTIQKLYHGTGQYHTQIDLRCSSNYKDFGRGYYLTSHRTQAFQWAESKRRGVSCWVFEYKLKDVPDTIRIKELLQYDKDWLNFIVAHRLYGERDHFDIIYNRMADNKFNTLSKAVQNYENGEIPAETALRILRFQRGDRDQFCFKTKASIALLTRTHTYTKSTNGIWHSAETEEESP